MIGTRTMLAGIAVGGLAAAAILGAQPAQADPGWPATTTITWSGTRCIDLESAIIGDEYESTIDTFCSDTGVWTFTQYGITAGKLFGANPIMGDADAIACIVARGGRVVYSSAASRGDGRDVNCLRRAY